VQPHTQKSINTVVQNVNSIKYLIIGHTENCRTAHFNLPVSKATLNFNKIKTH